MLVERCIPVGLHTHVGGLVLALFEGIAKGIAHALAKPAVDGTD